MKSVMHDIHVCTHVDSKNKDKKYIIRTHVPAFSFVQRRWFGCLFHQAPRHAGSKCKSIGDMKEVPLVNGFTSFK